MQLKHLAASLALTSTVSAQALTQVISQTPQLSTLGALLQQYPAVAQTLASATNITVLAPSNAAFSAFLTAQVNQSIAADAGLVPAVLSYHVLSGTIRSTAITATPAFAKTLLTNATYTNVTGGQVVKAQAMNGGVAFTSGLLKQSHVTTADVTFSGGVVHIIDSVLTIPVSASSTATGANLTALAGALTQTNLVSAVDGAKVSVHSCPSTVLQCLMESHSELTSSPGYYCLCSREQCFRQHCEPGIHAFHAAARLDPAIPRR